MSLVMSCFCAAIRFKFKNQYYQIQIHVLKSKLCVKSFIQYSKSNSTSLKITLSFCLIKTKIFKMPFLIFTSPDTVQHITFIYFKLEIQQKMLVVLQNHIAVSRGTFCGCTDRFTTQMFTNRGNINGPQHNINQQYLI